MVARASEHARRTKNAIRGTHLASIEEHGAGFIAERSRVEGLPVRAEQCEPSTRLLQSAPDRLRVHRACVAI